MRRSTRARPRACSVWILMLWVLGCGGPAETESPQSPMRRPQPTPRAIVLISLDTLRADHLGVYGHSRFTSPVLDQFAFEGVVFEDASSTSPWTLPAHASMLTGRDPSHHGLVSTQKGLAEEIETLAGWFSKAGWKTAAIVNSLWLKNDTYGLTRDFEDYLSVIRSDYKHIEPSSWITDEAMVRIEDQGETPLLLFLHYYDIHADYASLPVYEKLLVGPYAGKADGSAWQLMRANFQPEHIETCLREFDPDYCKYGSQEIPRRIDASMERVEFDRDDILHLEELYDAGIRQTDTEIGRFLNYLEEIGRADDTLVVVTSDHGEEFMEHGRMDHFLTVFQEVLHVPLLMRGPGVPAGERFDTPVSLVDIAPTLLSMAGLAPPRDLDGVDLSQLWREDGNLELEGRILYGEASGGLVHDRWLRGVYPIYRSVRRGNLKLVERVLGDEAEYELYDLAQDPSETTDLSLQQPDDYAELRALLDERAEIAAPAGSAVEMQPDEIEQLRALGYVP